MVILCGRLGRDPEIRTAQNGNKVASFSLATTKRWRDDNGERREKTEWHNIVVWNKGLVKVIEQYVKKGSLIHITGELQTRKWQDQNGNDRYTTEVVLNFDGRLELMPSGDRNNDGENRGSNRRDQDRDSNGGGGRQSQSYSRDIDDEIPF